MFSFIKKDFNWKDCRNDAASKESMILPFVGLNYKTE
jgi:hypothetical protein